MRYRREFSHYEIVAIEAMDPITPELAPEIARR